MTETEDTKVTKRFTVEFEIGDGELPNFAGEDLDYTICHALADIVREAGYRSGTLVAHMGRATRRYRFDGASEISKLT